MADSPSRQPTGDELKRVQDAILHAYRFESLKQMVRVQLDQNLIHLVPFVDQGLQGMVNDLVYEYASRPDGLHQLLLAARDGNPTNPELVAIAEDLLAINFTPLPKTEPSGQAGDVIVANIGDHVQYAAVGKHVTQVIHDYGTPSSAELETLADPLADLAPLPPSDLPQTPFRIILRFRPEDAAIFFGSGHDIRTLYERVTRPDQAPIIFYYGQSGVGKSSLLAAELMPRLKHVQQVKYAQRKPTPTVEPVPERESEPAPEATSTETP